MLIRVGAAKSRRYPTTMSNTPQSAEKNAHRSTMHWTTTMKTKLCRTKHTRLLSEYWVRRVVWIMYIWIQKEWVFGSWGGTLLKLKPTSNLPYIHDTSTNDHAAASCKSHLERRKIRWKKFQHILNCWYQLSSVETYRRGSVNSSLILSTKVMLMSTTTVLHTSSSRCLACLTSSVSHNCVMLISGENRQIDRLRK